jgi:glycosyltransferase involved in cell wall biosynthesis
VDVPPEKTRRLFLYFRPEIYNRRNLPEIILQAVVDFCAKADMPYEIYLAGTAGTRYSYSIGAHSVYVLGKLPTQEYFRLLRSCDVVVALIYSAHPGVVAFQAAASGIPTITNVFKNRDAALLKRISDNLIPFDPVRQDLAAVLREALGRPKGKKSFDQTLYAGNDEATLDDFVRRIMQANAAVQAAPQPGMVAAVEQTITR